MKVVARVLALVSVLVACGGDKPAPATPTATADAASSATPAPEMGGREGAADGGGLGTLH